MVCTDSSTDPTHLTPEWLLIEPLLGNLALQLPPLSSPIHCLYPLPLPTGPTRWLHPLRRHLTVFVFTGPTYVRHQGHDNKNGHRLGPQWRARARWKSKCAHWLPLLSDSASAYHTTCTLTGSLVQVGSYNTIGHGVCLVSILGHSWSRCIQKVGVRFLAPCSCTTFS